MTFIQTDRFRDCPWCGLRDAQMNLIGADMQALRVGPPDPRWWSALSCPRCGGIVAVEHTSPQLPTGETLSVVPAGQVASLSHLPSDVAEFYDGAKRVLDAGVPDAAVVQLRRTLEAAAAHKGIDTGPLIKRIEGLIEQGLITQDFGNVLHHIRQVGNVGAHASDERVDEEAARRAFRFTTQVLVNLFEIPAELAALGGEQGTADKDAA
jgi:hypothetical protein